MDYFNGASSRPRYTDIEEIIPRVVNTLTGGGHWLAVGQYYLKQEL